MDFPSNDCEQQVLKHLRIQNSSNIPFGVLHYIHASCQIGLPSIMIADHCARFLVWPKIFKKLRDAFPELTDTPLVEKELREIHQNKGIGSKFLRQLSLFLQAYDKRDEEAALLEERAKQRGERKKAWDAAMDACSDVRNMRHEQELLLEFEVFELLLEHTEQRLMLMADEEEKANTNPPSQAIKTPG